MATLSEESLNLFMHNFVKWPNMLLKSCGVCMKGVNKLTKSELITFSTNLLEKNKSIPHDVKDEVRELKECVKKTRGRTGPTYLRTLANCCQTNSSTWRDSAGLMLSTLDLTAWNWLEYFKVFQQVTWKKLFLKFWRKLGWKFQQRTLMHAIGLANKDPS